MHPSRLAKLGAAADPSKFSIPTATQIRTQAPVATPAPLVKQNVQLTAPRNFDDPPPNAYDQSWSLGRGSGGPSSGRKPAPSRFIGRGAPTAPFRSFPGRGGPPPSSRGPPPSYRGSAPRGPASSSSRGPPAPSRGPATPTFKPSKPTAPPPASVVKSAAGIHPDRLKMLGIKFTPAPAPVNSTSSVKAASQPVQASNWNSDPVRIQGQQPSSQSSTSRSQPSSDWRPNGIAAQTQPVPQRAAPQAQPAPQRAAPKSQPAAQRAAPQAQPGPQRVAPQTQPTPQHAAPQSQTGSQPAAPANANLNATYPPNANSSSGQAPPYSNGSIGPSRGPSTEAQPHASSQTQQPVKQDQPYQPFGFSSMKIGGPSNRKPSSSSFSSAHPSSSFDDNRPQPDQRPQKSELSVDVSSNNSVPARPAASSGWDSPPPELSTPFFTHMPGSTAAQKSFPAGAQTAPSPVSQRNAPPATQRTAAPASQKLDSPSQNLAAEATNSRAKPSSGFPPPRSVPSSAAHNGSAPVQAPAAAAVSSTVAPKAKLSSCLNSSSVQAPVAETKPKPAANVQTSSQKGAPASSKPTSSDSANHAKPVSEVSNRPSYDSASKENNVFSPTVSFETSSASILPADPKPQPTLSFATSLSSVLPKQSLGGSLKITAVFDQFQVVERRVTRQSDVPPQPSSLSTLFSGGNKSREESATQATEEWSSNTKSAYDWNVSETAPSSSKKPVLTARWYKPTENTSGWSASLPPPEMAKTTPSPQVSSDRPNPWLSTSPPSHPASASRQVSQPSNVSSSNSRVRFDQDPARSTATTSKPAPPTYSNRQPSMAAPTSRSMSATAPAGTLRQGLQFTPSYHGGWESDDEDESPNQIVAQLQSGRKAYAAGFRV